ncbi:uncharacterized protein YwqG [Haloactinospora alba]|uniref:Uncharacterized protein YwqG n=1 Tax=Haloactinospora alba TaxID=405555 RepID=A0A543NJ89_9ACTN|nr:DUF1963 domain-containing protein [Haloactinospora alba]TQN31888.1 uncharacterized protein YwqG [Haloactinospora alba]
MEPQELKTRIERLCTSHLGTDMGPRVAALFRNGFELYPTGEGEKPSGRCRFGGPALLEPGTPWPASEHGTLTLLAVLDTDALAPWLDVALPPGANLLNVFYGGYNDMIEDGTNHSRHAVFGAPRDWRVVPADPAKAVEAPAPSGVGTLPLRPVRAEPIVTVPDLNDTDFALGKERLDPEVREALAGIQEPLLELLPDDGNDGGFRHMHEHAPDLDAERRINGHRAFGWPWQMQGEPIADDSRLHLLQLDSDHLLQLDTDDMWEWGDGGMISLDIPAEALRAGDFSQVYCEFACC